MSLADKKLWYLPLEPYKERYTWFMSSVGGWTESHFNRLGINFERIEGKKIGNTINVGSVLDAYGRSYYALSQLQEIILKIREGEVSDGDVIYFEDFWHPGVESLAYIRDLSGIKFKLACFCHAQSVDDSDFCHSMRHWMRPFEQGIGKICDYVFTTSPILRQLLLDAGIGDKDTIRFVEGLQYNSHRLEEQLMDIGFSFDKVKDKQQYVIFSSRFDDEKNPMFFLDLVERCKDIQFRLVKPRAHLSNNKEVCERAERLAVELDNFAIVDTSDKLDYYNLLASAKVQINTADQDWSSWTIGEACHFKAIPLYPNRKDFPRLLNDTHLYEYLNLDECEEKLRSLMNGEVYFDFDYIVNMYDMTIPRYLKEMEFIDG